MERLPVELLCVTRQYMDDRTWASYQACCRLWKSSVSEKEKLRRKQERRVRLEKRFADEALPVIIMQYGCISIMKMSVEARYFDEAKMRFSLFCYFAVRIERDRAFDDDDCTMRLIAPLSMTYNSIFPLYLCEKLRQDLRPSEPVTSEDGALVVHPDGTIRVLKMFRKFVTEDDEDIATRNHTVATVRLKLAPRASAR
jgi:hypothetical protein